MKADLPKWNPHFVAYAKKHGRTPEAQMEHDQKEFPGGCMCGFILWIADMKRKFYTINRDAFVDQWSIWDHKAWGQFLQQA